MLPAADVIAARGGAAVRQSATASPAGSGRGTHFCATVTPEPYEIRRALLAMRTTFVPAFGAELAGRAELVVAEILNNIAEHGDLTVPSRPLAGERRAVHLSVAPSGGGLVCIVSDEGVAVPRDCLAPRSLPQGKDDPGNLPEGGFGWFMIQTMTQPLYYGRDGDRNVLAVLIPDDSPMAMA